VPAKGGDEERPEVRGATRAHGIVDPTGVYTERDLAPGQEILFRRDGGHGRPAAARRALLRPRLSTQSLIMSLRDRLVRFVDSIRLDDHAGRRGGIRGRRDSTPAGGPEIPAGGGPLQGSAPPPPLVTTARRIPAGGYEPYDCAISSMTVFVISGTSSPKMGGMLEGAGQKIQLFLPPWQRGGRLNHLVLLQPLDNCLVPRERRVAVVE